MKKLDPTKPVQTRDGREAGIYSNDNGGKYPIHGWINYCGERHPKAFTEEGRFYGVGEESPDDLVNIPEYPPLPEVEGGRLEYRGKGWTNGGKPCDYYCFEMLSGVTEWTKCFNKKAPSGYPEVHYAEFIPDTPTTVRGWLETIEDKALRERALELMNDSKAAAEATSFRQAMLRAFITWANPEGAQFWGDVADGTATKLPDTPTPAEPELFPYTLENFPMGAVWVKLKGNATSFSILAKTHKCVVISNGRGTVEKTYDQLLQDYEIAGTDGVWHPAGQCVNDSSQ
jgi:hypothetical protein